MALKPYWRAPAPLTATSALLERRVEEGAHWVRPADCVFYPESGGQRGDRGWLGAVEVLDVQEREGAVWLRLAGPPDDDAPRQRVDAEQRRDHSEQHSGQHLLSAVCLELLGAATLGFHMGETVSTVELDVDAVTDADLRRVESRVAERIRAALPIRVHYPDAAAAAALPLRKEPGAVETLRVVEIADCDFSPCGGTHLANTLELRALFLGRRERIRGRWRIEFLAGARAIAAAAAGLPRERELAEVLSCGVTELPERVAALRADAARLQKTERRLRELEGAALARELETAGDWETLAGGWTLLRRDCGDLEREVLGAAAAALCRTPERLLLFLRREPGRLDILCQRGRGPGPDMGALLRELLAEFDGRGGGGPDRAQGTLAETAGDRCLERARALLTAALASGGEGGA